MAKRCYYETLSVERTATESRHQGRVSQAGDGCVIPIAIPATRKPSTASRKSTRPMRSSRTRTSAPPTTASATPLSSTAWAAGRRGFGADFGTTFSDLFEGIFGMSGSGGRGRGAGRERGADLRYNMEITLPRPTPGKNAQIRIPTSVTCEACSGSGAKAGTKPKTCPMCGGQGTRPPCARDSSRSSAPARIAAAAASRSTAPARHAPAPAGSRASGRCR